MKDLTGLIDLNEPIEKFEIAYVSSYIKNKKVFINISGIAETKTKQLEVKVTDIDTGIVLFNPSFEFNKTIRERYLRSPIIEIENFIKLGGEEYSMGDFLITNIQDKTKEVTMADIEKKFGCKVKIVGE